MNEKEEVKDEMNTNIGVNFVVFLTFYFGKNNYFCLIMK